MAQTQRLLLIAPPTMSHTPAFERAAALAVAMQLPLHIVAFDYLQALAVAGLFAPEQIRLARDGYLRTHRQWLAEQGKLLDNMLKAIDLEAGRDVYITHLLKCRPLDEAGQERLPTEAESAACRPYFERELALLQPRTIVTLGSMAAAGINPGEKPVRGKVRQLGNASVVATFHPEQLLQDGTGKAKARAWADLCLAKSTHGG